MSTDRVMDDGSVIAVSLQEGVEGQDLCDRCSNDNNTCDPTIKIPDGDGNTAACSAYAGCMVGLCGVGFTPKE